MKDNQIIASVKRWLEHVIIGLNLCPFAKRELIKDRVRFVDTDATTEQQLLVALEAELLLLNKDSSIETTLLIHADVLQEFYDYNQFLDLADGLLEQMSLQGVYQIASFHPHYQFAETAPEDVENYTNRSPYPILHILREESLERAIADYADVDQIPVRNIELMNELGITKVRALMQDCLVDAAKN